MQILHRDCRNIFWVLSVFLCGIGTVVGQESRDVTSPPIDSVWTQLGIPEPSPDAPHGKQPELPLLFEDDFSADSRDKYEIRGVASSIIWEAGQIVLKQGDVLAREINANDWLETEIDLQFPELKSDGQTSECILRLNLDGATNCQFVWRRERMNGVVRSKVAILDLVEPTENSAEMEPHVVRQIELDSDLSNGRWQVSYRNGLCRVSNLDSSTELYGYIPNGIVRIGKLEFLALSEGTTCSRLKTSRVVPVAGDFTDTNATALAQIDRLERRFSRFFQNGDVGKALSAAEELVIEKGKILGQFHAGFASSLHNLAEMHYLNGDYLRAELGFRQAAAIREQLLGKNHPDYATSLNNLALISYNKEDFTNAESLYRQCMTINRIVHGEDHHSYAANLNNVALFYHSIGDFAQAEPLYVRSAEILKKDLSSQLPAYLQVSNNLAGLYFLMGDFSRAEPLFLESIDVYETELKDYEYYQSAYTTCLNNLALLYFTSGDYARAEPIFVKANEIHKRGLARDIPEFPNNLSEMALLYYSMGDYARAEPLYLEAMETCERALGTENSTYAMIINNMGGMYLANGNASRAEELFLEANTIRERLSMKEHRDYAITLGNLASLSGRKGDYETAERLLIQAKEILEKVRGRKHPDFAHCLSNLGSLYFSKAEYSRAEPLYRESIEIYKDSVAFGHPDVAQSLNSLARLYKSMGNPEQAHALFREGFELTVRHLETTAVIQSESQQLRMAQQAEYQLAHYLSAVAESNAAARDAMNGALMWKGAIFARQRLMRLARTTNDPKIHTLMGELRSVSSRLAQLSTNPPTAGPRKDVWRRQLDDLSGKREQLERELSAASTEFRAIKAETKVDVDHVLSTLPQNAMLVDIHVYQRKTGTANEYGVLNFEPAYCAFVLRKGRPVEFVDLGFKSQVDKWIGQWRENYGVSSGNGADPAQELRQILWEPLAKFTDGVETVVISPDGEISTLPLIALPGKMPGTYLLEEVAIVNFSFPQFLPELMKDAEQESGSQLGLLLVGDVDFDQMDKSPSDGDTNSTSDPEVMAVPTNNQDALTLAVTARLNRSVVYGKELERFERLTGSKLEISRIADDYRRLFDPETIQILADSQATKERFQTLATQCRFLHVATHGLFAPEAIKSAGADEIQQSDLPTDSRSKAPVVGIDPRLLSGLVFAGANQSADSSGRDTSILSALEVGEMNLATVELAVLSACDTGRGKVAGGEGTLGLQRAFQVAGARTTVTSLWRVNDQATQVLMSRFYRNLWERKLSKVESLREAQLWMLRQPDEVEVELRKLRGGEDELDDGTDRTIASAKHWAAWVLSGDWR